MHYYCTLFDHNYFAHFLCMYDSLNYHDNNCFILAYTLNNESYDLVSKYLNNKNIKNVSVIHIDNVVDKIKGAKEAKENRSQVEFYYTCSSLISFYSFKVFNEIQILTYLDSDLFFFNSTKPIYDELENMDIGIIEHRHYNRFRKKNPNGIYNVGWITFKKSINTLRCVIDWKNNCLNWCFLRHEDNKYADQKYLDKWPSNYQRVHVIKNKGANVAIWNLGQYKVTKSDNIIYIDNEPLIFYHFANFNQLSENKFNTNLSRFFTKLTPVIRNEIYLPYIFSIKRNQQKDYLIKTKADYPYGKILQLIVYLSRRIRYFLYPDIIQISD